LMLVFKSLKDHAVGRLLKVSPKKFPT
jgi:hypothetical protein